jgi:sec-independent protein translocase protein TatA
MGPIGAQELIIVLVIVILIFGASRIPQLGGALGKGIKEFRSGIREPGDVDEQKELRQK